MARKIDVLTNPLSIAEYNSILLTFIVVDKIQELKAIILSVIYTYNITFYYEKVNVFICR